MKPTETKLTGLELEKKLKEFSNWVILQDKLHRVYVFEDFAQAVGFITMAALKIEAMDHHPEWSNVYNRVTVDLISHSAGGITMKDFALAAVLDKVAQPFI